MGRFKFKGHEETDVTLPGEAMQVVRVVPGEVVELEHQLEDEEQKLVGLARHLWEETTDKVGKPNVEQPKDDTPSDPPASDTTRGSLPAGETPGDGAPPPAPEG